MLRLELAVPENLMRLGKAAMQRLVSELARTPRTADDPQRRQVSLERVSLEDGARLYEMFTVLRAYYASSMGQGLAPLDERPGIAHGHTISL